MQRLAVADFALAILLKYRERKRALNVGEAVLKSKAICGITPDGQRKMTGEKSRVEIMRNYPLLPQLKKPLQHDLRVRRLRVRRRGFTLVEILVVIAIVSLLTAIGFGTFSRVRESARQIKCDTNLKNLAVALDAFKQEKGHYPVYLRELVAGKYITDTSWLHCPDDPEPDSDGYGDFYIQRSARNDVRFGDVLPVIGELPTIVCPFHEKSGHGFQAFAGMQTHNFATKPAILTSANATSIERPGVGALAGVDGMELHGADRIRTAGAALLTFADGSTCQLSAGSDITVLQSFVTGSETTLYTLVRQALGDVIYSVHHGSKFDVSTPTATAGALGTEFRIKIVGTYSDDNAVAPDYSEEWVDISQSPTSRVACGMPSVNTVIPPHVEVDMENDMLGKPAKTGQAWHKARQSQRKERLQQYRRVLIE